MLLSTDAQSTSLQKRQHIGDITCTAWSEHFHVTKIDQNKYYWLL